MKNKWFQVTIAVILWAFFANSLFSPHGGFIGRFIHRIVGKILPPDILGMPSLTIVFIILTIIYSRLAYAVIFSDRNREQSKL